MRPLIGAVMITMSTQAAAECRTQSDTTWVLFKTVGLIVLTIGFFAANMPLIRRYALPEDDSR